MIRALCMRIHARFLQVVHNNRRTRRFEKCGKWLNLELLESRDVPNGAQPFHVQIVPNGDAGAFGTGGPTGYTPAQIRHAYGFDKILFNGTTAGDGTGTTIAIVDAFDDPRIANDLHQFNLEFGLPDPPSFIKVNQNGGSKMPPPDGGWASEIALDVEWAHAIAPKANILLVEADDNSFTNLLAGVSYAANQPGVVAVSMSFGGGEFSSETSFDSVFTTPAGHVGVTFIASSGDTGAPTSYPAASPNVLSVGGSWLDLDSAGNILGESGWTGSGGGISAYEVKPAYQNGIVVQSATKRANPDVAYDADPNTGFPVYDTYNNSVAAPWSQFGGTSDAAPQWAALIAIASQGRALAGLNPLDGPTQTLPALYNLPNTDFHDITSGTSTGIPNYSAGLGYDLVSGRGSPFADRVVADLVGNSNPGTHFSISAPSTSIAGVAFSITVTAVDANGNATTNYTGTTHFTSSDGAAVLPTDYTFTKVDAGSHTFSVTLKTSGNKSVTATDVVNGSFTGSASVAVSPAAASKLAFSQQPANTPIGSVITPPVMVQVQDQFGNRVTSDNSHQVVLTIGSNPGGGALGGTVSKTVSAGVATFNNLTIDKIGTGYMLVATSASLTQVTSSSFNVVAGGGGVVIEDFETAKTWKVAGFGGPSAFLGTIAAHDGSLGMVDYNSSDWIYRTDAGVHVQAGDTVSVWLKFNSVANGRAYFGFGASLAGTLSLVAAPNTNQLILQTNVGFGFTDLAAVSATYLPNHWYRLQVDWGVSGKLIGRLFDTDGATQLRSVTGTTTRFTAGGIALRATGNYKFWDTVTNAAGVNPFASSPRAVSPILASPRAGVVIGIAPSDTQHHTAAQMDALLELYLRWTRTRKSHASNDLVGWRG
jgi:hypothetical protein